jgi:hypothetical protein
MIAIETLRCRKHPILQPTNGSRLEMRGNFSGCRVASSMVDFRATWAHVMGERPCVKAARAEA